MGIINVKIFKCMYLFVKQGKDGQDGIFVDFDIFGQWLERWEGWKDGRMEGQLVRLEKKYIIYCMGFVCFCNGFGCCGLIVLIELYVLERLK